MDKILLILLLFLLPINGSAQENINIDTSQIYLFVDSLPTMPDGSDIQIGFSDFLHNFQFPDSVHCDYISRIIFELVVTYDGSITNKKVWILPNLEVCKDDSEKIITKGLKYLDNFPRCRPGMNNGKYVNVKLHTVMHIHLQ